MEAVMGAPVETVEGGEELGAGKHQWREDGADGEEEHRDFAGADLADEFHAVPEGVVEVEVVEDAGHGDLRASLVVTRVLGCRCRFVRRRNPEVGRLSDRPKAGVNHEYRAYGMSEGKPSQTI